MNGMAVCERVRTVAVPGDMTELVRGKEIGLLELLEPLVRSENISLDMSGVERVDAAGLSVLIRLYCDATKAGREFRVAHPGRHVREVLGVVWLDRLLFGQEAGNGSENCNLTAA